MFLVWLLLLQKPIPEFMAGDECLFCHRKDVASSWQKNYHMMTLRQREDAPELESRLKGKPFAQEVQYFLGSRNHVRFLKKAGYNKLAIYTDQGWDANLFAGRCAGCHATAMDSAKKTFASIGLDCYTCHGVAPMEHTGGGTRPLLGPGRKDDPVVAISICAQCHLRGGKSRSTGLPYPNNFVPGEKLFVDFEVEKADSLNPGDRHVYRNVRDVLAGRVEVTCMTCHKIHAQSTAGHAKISKTATPPPLCQDCHPGGRRKVSYEVHSRVCEY